MRDYSREPLTQRQLSYLLWVSGGIRARENDYEFRTVPSAGALFDDDVNRLIGVDGREESVVYMSSVGPT